MSSVTEKDKKDVKYILDHMKYPQNIAIQDIFAYDGDYACDYYGDFTYQGEQLFTNANYGASKTVYYFNPEHPDPAVRELAKHLCIKIPVEFDEDEDYPYTEAGRSIDNMNDNLFPGEEEYDYSEWDYCNTEAQIYKYLKHRQCEAPFAETFHVTDIDGYPFYAAELMETDCCFDYDPESYGFDKGSKDYEAIENRSVSYDFDGDALKFAIAADYSIEIAFSVLFFCGIIRMNDVYLGRNCGKDSEGRVKILDYSSFSD